MKPDSAISLMVALYQPDIQQNTGTIVRMRACTTVIIEPAGFPASEGISGAPIEPRYGLLYFKQRNDQSMS